MAKLDISVAVMVLGTLLYAGLAGREDFAGIAVLMGAIHFMMRNSV